MRVSLVLASLAAHALARLVHSPTTRRKTLGFGPDLPHARFETLNVLLPVAADVTKDAFTVARDLLSAYDDSEAGRTYVIRPDSYTDHATGVTHIYARQIVGGIEVSNAHVNVNVKDGRVLSFGDSFFPGEVWQNAQVPAHARAQYCAQLFRMLDLECPFFQSPLASQDRPRLVHALAHLEHVYDSSCADVPTLSSFADLGEVDMDPRRPLLAFLAFALPENHPGYTSMRDNIEEHVSNIVMTPEPYPLGEHASLGMSLSNVPGVVSDVKARIVWIQVPTEHGVKLELVHRFEVEMEHNWYETTITTTVPHQVISVVDWARDSPMPVSVSGEVASAPVQEMHGTSGKAHTWKEGDPRPPELNRASYLVFPWGTNDPVDAARKKAMKRGEPVEAKYPLSYGREIMKELGDTLASPAGWHTLPLPHDPSVSDEDKIIPGSSYWRTTDTTWGNNVFAHENWEGKWTWVYNERPYVHTDGTFSYTYSPTAMDTESDSVEEAKKYVNASVTQLFYTSNMVHDLFYRYGFTEAAGNFQQYNFGRGGEEGDAIIADAQYGDAFNNAVFMTPPDGQNGRCRIFLWDTDSPYPDGDMEADITIHELSHGLSTRLTGGPKNSGCLGWGEAAGMGEGWGDYIAITVRSTFNYSDYTVGAWALNDKDGIRHYPYSINFSVNPSTYETLGKLEFFGLHAIGEVWAEMLWVIQRRLIAKHGFSDTLLPPVPNADGTLPHNNFYRPQTFNPRTGSLSPLVPKHGNTLMLQLVINGMKMHPCKPSFFDARAAIIEADKILTGGENVCDIWEGFAERGLGVDAHVVFRMPWDGPGTTRTNGFNVPTECRSSEPEAGSQHATASTSEPSASSNDRGFWYSIECHIEKWMPEFLWGYIYRR